jgi:predicted DNA-binding transcriptional regulator AlpA
MKLQDHSPDTVTTTAVDPGVSEVQTRHLLGDISSPTFWRMRQRGEFPQPIRVARGRSVYRLSWIVRYLDRREAERADR